MATELPIFLNHHNYRPQNPNHRFVFSDNNEPAMDKFRQVVMKIVQISGSTTNPAAPVSGKELIEERLNDFFSSFHTPNHPPYAAMIEKAILELKRKGGSNEESISNYIKLEYKDLPWAHSTIVKHHLNELCDCGDLSMTSKSCYVIGVPEPKRGKLTRRKKSKSQSARRWAQGRKKEESNEQEKNVVIENKNEDSLVEINVVEEQNLIAIEEVNEFDIKEQENLLMDLYPVPIKLQNPEISLSVTEHLEPVMYQKISENESESENVLIQEQEYVGKSSPANLALPVKLDVHEKDNDEKLQNSEKVEKNCEKTDLALSSEQNDDKGNNTDRWQRQLKRWMKSPPKVKPNQTHTMNKTTEDEEKNEKQEPGIGVEDSCLAIVELQDSRWTVKESSPTLREIMEAVQPKRQLRSQSRCQALFKRGSPSTSEKSTELKQTKANTSPSYKQDQEADTLKSQPKCVTRSIAAKLIEPKSATPLQRRKLRSWNKQNESDSNASTLDLALLQTEYNDPPQLAPESSDAPAKTDHQTPDIRDQAPRRSKRGRGKP